MYVHRAIRRTRHGSAASLRPRVLFIAGSLNQTTQLHAVARELHECEARFTPYYGDLTVTALRHLGLLEPTIGGNKRRGRQEDDARGRDAPREELPGRAAADGSGGVAASPP